MYGSSKLFGFYRKTISEVEQMETNVITDASEAKPKKINILNCLPDNVYADPGRPTPESAREAIGHFTYDVSVVMGSSFSETGTFTQPEGVATAITEFGYPVGFLYVDGESWSDETKGPNADSALRNNLILARRF